jgi:hypothetical protein
MKLDREFERFRGGPTVPFRDRMHVSLQAGRKIYLNQNAHRLLGRPTGVYLYFNRERDEIALEPTSPRLAEAFPVRGARNGFVVYIAPFAQHFGISLTGTHRFVAPEIDQHGILHLKLSNIVHVSRGPRRARR